MLWVGLEACFPGDNRRIDAFFALLHGGEAHNSYWQSDQVAQQIAQAIERALQPPSAADKVA